MTNLIIAGTVLALIGGVSYFAYRLGNVKSDRKQANERLKDIAKDNEIAAWPPVDRPLDKL